MTSKGHTNVAAITPAPNYAHEMKQLEIEFRKMENWRKKPR